MLLFIAGNLYFITIFFLILNIVIVKFSHLTYMVGKFRDDSCLIATLDVLNAVQWMCSRLREVKILTFLVASELKIELEDGVEFLSF